LQPLLRVAALMVLRSHMLAAISIGPHAESEIRHAEQVAASPERDQTQAVWGLPQT